MMRSWQGRDREQACPPCPRWGVSSGRARPPSWMTVEHIALGLPIRQGGATLVARNRDGFDGMPLPLEVLHD